MKTTNPLRFGPLATTAGVLFALSLPGLAAPIPMTGAGSYSQDFNSLPSVTPDPVWLNDSNLAGWYAEYETPASPSYLLRVSTGSLSTGSIYSFGATSNTERAFGSIGSGTPDDIAYGVLLENTSGTPLTINSLSYTGEQWRNGGNATAHSLTLSGFTSPTAITALDPVSVVPAGWTAIPSGDFLGPISGASSATLDGNLPANRVAISATPSLTVLPGHFAFIRWHDPDNSGNDHGLAVDDLTISWVVETLPALTVSATPTTFAENAGATASAGTVSIPAALGADLIVTLASSDTTEASVPATVTITAGNTSANFDIAAVNDFLADGEQSSTITATATGYTSGQVALTVEEDADTAIGILIDPTTFSEAATNPAAAGLVQLAEATLVDLTVSLTSNDPSEATVPASVVILAGNDSAVFDVTAVDDGDVDGNRTFNILASATGYTTGSTSITVTDEGDTPPPATISTGGIAFTAYNAGSDDDFAFVALEAIDEGETIIFSDNEWNGGTLGAGGAFVDLNEGEMTWTAPAGGVAAGTVVIFSDIALTTRSVSAGTISNTTNFALAAGGDTIYAFQGAPLAPTRFLAAISVLAAETIDGTGLASENLVRILTETADTALYIGPRNNQATFAGYLPLISNAATNWEVSEPANNAAVISSTAFTLGSGGTDYDTWVTANSVTEGPTGDDDDDGLDNTFEYRFGLNPKSGASVSPIVAPLNKTTAKFTYTRRALSLTGLTAGDYQVFTSTTLGTASWTEDAGATVSVLGTVDGVETVEVTLSATAPLAASALFVRVVSE